MNELNVQAIFNSIDGEVNGFYGAGEPSTFIRLKGCNLRCQWCDTQYAQSPEPRNLMSIDKILSFPNLLEKITITGGEPLIQRTNLSVLVVELLTGGCRITIETNGTEPPLEETDTSFQELRYVVDYKLPSSGMQDSMYPKVFELLSDEDIIKFVIAGIDDYSVAKELVLTKEEWRARKVFSPLFTQEQKNWPAKLAEMILEDRDIREEVQFSLQLHKILWPNATEER